MKKFILSLFTVLMAVTAYADEIVIDFTSSDALSALGITAPEKGKGTEIANTTITKDGVILTSKNGSTATRIWNSNGALDLRIYKSGGSITLTAPDGQAFQSVKFTSGNKSAVETNMDVNAGTLKDSTWTGSSATITFSAKATIRINTITITTAASTVKTYKAPTFSLEEGEYIGEQEVTITAEEGCGLIYTTDDTTPVEGNGTYVKEGTATIKVSKTTTVKAITVDNSDPDLASVISSATYTISQEVGSVESPLTVGEAKAYINAGVNLDYYVFTKGIITSVDKIDISDQGIATYFIATGKDTIEVYKGFDLNNAKFTDIEAIAKGDVVIVYGKLTKYNKIYEYTAGSYIVSIDKSGRDAEEIEEVTPLALSDFTNTGFETWTDGVANQWKSTSTASNATIEQSTNAHSGSSAVLVKSADKNMRLASTELVVPAGNYTLKFYAKNASADAIAKLRYGYATTTITDLKNAYNSPDYNYLITATEVQNDWTEYKYTFTTEEESIMCLVVMVSKNTADILVDDLTLTTATEEEMLSISSVNTDKKANSAIVNLAGQRVDASFKGIVIKNGKKVLVK
ncbi:MAG: carbohydrate binding domain-containing protein [Bacteroidaceae bacterium]|nr:carbohydrate binding domain-containing protein [Bacteroidaceae bacterium]